MPELFNVTARLTENHGEGHMFRGRDAEGNPIEWVGTDPATHVVDAANVDDLRAEYYIEILDVQPAE